MPHEPLKLAHHDPLASLYTSNPNGERVAPRSGVGEQDLAQTGGSLFEHEAAMRPESPSSWRPFALGFLAAIAALGIAAVAAAMTAAPRRPGRHDWEV